MTISFQSPFIFCYPVIFWVERWDRIKFMRIVEKLYWIINAIMLVKNRSDIDYNYWEFPEKNEFTKEVGDGLLPPIYWEYVGVLHHYLTYQALASGYEISRNHYRYCPEYRSLQSLGDISNWWYHNRDENIKKAAHIASTILWNYYPQVVRN